MAKPIIIIYPAFGSQNDHDNGFQGFPLLAETVSMWPNAAQDAGFPMSELSFKTWWVQQPDLAKSLKLGSLENPLLPQLLFATPDPNGKAGELLVLAKLVKEQINRANLALMLKVVGRLKKKADPTGNQGFYDPTLQVPTPPIGVNPAAAAGGWMIGLNATTYAVELSRYGQMFDELNNFFKKNWLLLAAAGAALFIATRDNDH